MDYALRQIVRPIGTKEAAFLGNTRFQSLGDPVKIIAAALGEYIPTVRAEAVGAVSTEVCNRSVHGAKSRTHRAR